MTIDDRLENWSRYYRERIICNTCGSIEKMYRAPWRQWVSLSDIAYQTIIDWRDAELVERTWRQMPQKPKMLLLYSYMTGFPIHAICRKSGVKVWLYEAKLRNAKNILQSLLNRRTIATK
jgi:DNA-directed RNA polymerase specialized sigma24 family protein